MHTLLDYDGKLPAYVNITDGKTGDNKGAEGIPLQAGSVIVADRYYNDFPLLSLWDSKGVNFVIRHKSNLKYVVTKEREMPPTRAQHIMIDQEIELSNTLSKEKYSGKLRRVAVWDEVLHIKTFIGTSKNAVMIQKWTALITILILKYLKNIAKYRWHLSNLVAFIRLNCFVKIDLLKWLNKPLEPPPKKPSEYAQGVLF